MRRVAVGVAGLAVLGLVAGGVWTTNNHQGDGESPPVALGRTQSVAALTPMSDCATLLKHFKEQAADVVGPYGLGGTQMMTFGGAERAMDDSSGSSSAASAPQAAPKAEAAPDSTTNVQVAGVDESDVVKTDGDLMLAIVDGQLRIVRMADGGTRTIATWSDSQSQALSLLVSGTRVVVIGNSYQGGVYPLSVSPSGVASDDIMPRPQSPTTRITVLDISDPENSRTEQTLELDGSMNGSARLVGGELRFALSSTPDRIRWKQPIFPQSTDTDDQSKAFDRATQQNRKILEKTTIDDWLPKATITTDGQHVSRDLVDCPDMSVPKTFSGLQTLAMVQIPLDGENPLSSWRSAGVLAADGILYANADHAWLATQQWGVGGAFAPMRGDTQIHLFDTPAGGPPKYEGSGSVDGNLVSQFAMDEQNDVLRVATTVDGRASDNQVSTLKPAGGKLVRLGRLTGLGKGEQIRGVRFMGDLGYVVTFRQTDPLYTVDLSDPAKPVLRGELKIPGYSAYLHPAGDGRVLGLGQDGTQGGQTTGLQLSLFDVTKADATRLDRVTLPGAWSDAESDHHAFTMTGKLVLVPFSGPSAMVKMRDPSLAPDTPVAPADGSSSSGSAASPQPYGMESGVLAAWVDGSSIGVPQKLTTPANPMRALVHAGDVYTLTSEGVAVHRVDGHGFSKVMVARF